MHTFKVFVTRMLVGSEEGRIDVIINMRIANIHSSLKQNKLETIYANNNLEMFCSIISHT